MVLHLFFVSHQLNKHAFQKKTDVPKTEENLVVSKLITLQTSPTKQTGANQNINVIKPGMYRVVTTLRITRYKTKSALSSTGMNATSRVRRPMSRDSHVVHSVLDNSKKAAKNVAVYVRKNKQTAPNTMFSEKETQSKTLDTTFVVSKSKIDVERMYSKAKVKVYSEVMGSQIASLWSTVLYLLVLAGSSVRFRGVVVSAIIGYGDYIHGNITICHVYYVEDLGINHLSVGKFCDGDLVVAFSSPIPCLRTKSGKELIASRLSHLNYGTINDLTILDLVDGLPKFKYGKDHLCS
ncbi:hypothetical protein Tco_0973321 [Tanacetum coccineum]